VIPFELTFQPQSSHVLHLIGVDNGIRRSIFMIALKTLWPYYFNASLPLPARALSDPPKGLGITGEAIGIERRSHLLTQRRELLTSIGAFLPLEISSQDAHLIRDTFTVSGTEFDDLLTLLNSLEISTSLLCEVEGHLQALHSTVPRVCEGFTKQTVRLISEISETLSSTLTSTALFPLSSLLTQCLNNLWRVERNIPNGLLLLEVLQRLHASTSRDLEGSREEDDLDLRHAHDVIRYRLSAAALDMSFLYVQQQQPDLAKSMTEIGLPVSSDWISSAYLSSPSAAPQYIFIHLSLLSFYGQYLMMSLSLSPPELRPPADVELAIESVRESLRISALVYRQTSAEKMTFCDKTLDIHISGLRVLREEQEKRRTYQRILELVDECRIVLSPNRRFAITSAMEGLLGTM
jgi:hypothetical protein